MASRSRQTLRGRRKPRWEVWAKSPTGWYVVTMVERFECYDEDTANLNRRCLAWENVCLFKAKDPDAAYRKALKWGGMETSECVDSKGRKGKWKFVGIREILPMYDEFQDGAEVLWIKHANKTVRSVEAMVCTKEELAIFSRGIE
ncbi:MAG: DUF4288 domain-containing protein [Planctomycetes bacterium]|nr:DUF4288 domain-containing protein [Planctomycetota bacterium]